LPIGSKIDGNGALVTKMNWRADMAKSPGDSCEVLVHRPINVEFIPHNIEEKDRKKEAWAFLHVL
jgi:hypothetical protein